jgi:lipopolysaccharide export system protein LptA
MITPLKISLIVFLSLMSFVSFSQIVTPPTPDTTKKVSADSVKEFEIIRGPSMRSIHVDSVTTLQTIAGGAVVKQGTTIFTADSIAINPGTHIVEAFGNVHINQADSVQTYAQYLKYIGTEKTAYLKKDVRLNDKKGTVYTQDLDYNLGTGIGNYHDGGKVINGKTTITSQDGTYYADTKDIYFKNNVVVNEPKNHITTDSLLYNLRTQASNYVGNTHINNKEVDIYTTQGTYDFNTGNALFTSRTTVRDSSNRVYIANNMALDNKSGNAQLEGNAIVKDSAGGYIVFADQIFLNKTSNSFLATRKPVLIIKQKDDSIYVAADTIFSGYSTEVKNEDFINQNKSVSNDSLHKRMMVDTLQKADTSKKFPAHKLKNEQDSSYNLAHEIDSLNAVKGNAKPKTYEPVNDSSQLISLHKDSTRSDSVKNIPTLGVKNKQDSSNYLIPKKDSSHSVREKAAILKSDTASADSSKATLYTDSTKSNFLKSIFKRKDSAQLTIIKHQKDSTHAPDSSRYFLAFHHVRIFNDSLQSICDSLFFSAKDSVFRLYYDPVIWSGHTQITGDTIFLFTKNKKPERLYAFDKGIIVNKTTQGFYNQISGKTINGYFKGGAIDYMRVRGSQAESIYYAQDNDSAYLGMNRASGDVIDLYFDKDDLKKVLFINDIKGSFYPMRQIPEDQRKLKDFIWLQDKRPKNKLELFE